MIGRKSTIAMTLLAATLAVALAIGQNAPTPATAPATAPAAADADAQRLMALRERRRGPTFPGTDPAFLVLPRPTERSPLPRELLQMELPDVAAVAKLKDTNTSDTLCDDKGTPVVYDMITFPNASLSFAIEAKAKGDEDKIVQGLTRLGEEDPTVRVTRNAQTHEIILSGMGTGHLETTVEKLRRKFGVEVLLKTPKVPYKETIKGKATVRYRHKKQSGGRGQFGECEIVISPKERGTGYEFIDKIFGGSIPRQFIPAVDKGILETCVRGVIAGYPFVDFQVELIDGKYHPVDSSEMAFKMAGSMAFKQSAQQAKPTLLEPIMKMEIVVPEENTGDIMGDLSSRRGAVSGYETKGKNTVVKAQVPMAEILRYEPDLRSMTSGKGTFMPEFSHYEEVPHEAQQKIIEAYQKEKEE